MTKISNREKLLEFLKTKLEVSEEAEEHLNKKDFLEEELPHSNFMVLEEWNLSEGFYCKLYYLENRNSNGFKEILADYFSDDDVDDVTGEPARVLNYNDYLNNPIAVIDLERRKVFRMEVKTSLVIKDLNDEAEKWFYGAWDSLNEKYLECARNCKTEEQAIDEAFKHVLSWKRFKNLDKDTLKEYEEDKEDFLRSVGIQIESHMSQSIN